MCRCVTNPSTNNTTENGEGLLAANAIFQGHKNTHTHTTRYYMQASYRKYEHTRE